MKTYSLLFLFAFCISQIAIADDSLGGCTVQIPKMLSESNEWLANGCQKDLISTGDSQALQERYSRNLDSKFSGMVAKQLKQLLEDLGTTSDFYEVNEESFPDTGKICNLEFIKSIEKSGCSGNGATSEEKEKFKMLTDALGGDRFKSKTLMDSALRVYSANKYGEDFGENTNQCPLNGSAFPLNSQITNSSAQSIIQEFLKQDNGPLINELYLKYPQLSMIKSSGLQTEFEDHIKAFKGKKEDSKKYLSKFFFNPKNKEKFKTGVIHNCQQVQSSLSSFVCHPLSNKLPQDKKISKKLLDGYDTSKSFDEQSKKVQDLPQSRDIAGYKCIVSRNEKASLIEAAPVSSGSLTNDDPNFCFNLSDKTSSVDSYYRCFNEGVRPEGMMDNTIIGNFCSMYTCQNPIVKNTLSCKNGGPLTSGDLKNLNLNDDTILNQIAYMENLEFHLKKREVILASLNSGVPLSPDSVKGLSPFDINLFGLEGALKAINIPERSISLVMSTPAITNNFPKPTTSEQVQKIVNREPLQDSEEMFGRELAANNSQSFPSSSVASGNYTGNSLMNTNFPTESNHITGVHSTNKVLDSNFSISDSKAESTIDQMKKDLKTLADSENTSPSRSIVSGPTIASERSPKKYDQDYAKELAAKDSQLRQRESEVISRENTVWERERAEQRRKEELDQREKELNDHSNRSEEPQTTTPAASSGNVSNTNFDSKAAKLAQDKEDLKATHNGLTVTPDKLTKLEKEDLISLGVNIEAPFIIRVKVGDKLVSVRVAKVKKENGEAYLEPYLNEDSKEVRQAILKSPIFREFRYYLDQKNSAYSPVKKLKKNN